jgi:tRNA pseudouridine38-40 synthase
VRLFDPDDAAVSAADVREAVPAGPLRRVRLLVAYDGGSFNGFASQPGQRTVAGKLVVAFERLAGHPVSVTCAGRTDTGVHAAGQVVHADVSEAFFEAHPDRGRLVRSLTKQVGPEIAVLDVERAAAGFDARRSALSRRYRYLVLRRFAADPLLRQTTWHVPGGLDVAAMRLAVDTLLGQHDFSAFCRRPPNGGSMVRRVTLATVRPVLPESGPPVPDLPRPDLLRPDLLRPDLLRPDLLRIEIEANAFCHQMVRSIVGAVVSVGEGRLNAAGLLEMLRSGERSGRARLAPPGGLCLEAVRYPSNLVPGGVWLPPDGAPSAEWAGQ